MQIEEKDNFIEIYEIPRDRNRGFCFGGGHQIPFRQVDWFNPVPQDTIDDFDWSELKALLIECISKKIYFKPEQSYLAITHFGESFMFGSEQIGRA